MVRFRNVEVDTILFSAFLGSERLMEWFYNNVVYLNSKIGFGTYLLKRLFSTKFSMLFSNGSENY